MPVVVSPPSGQAPSVVRSVGAESTLSSEDTLADGPATGGVDSTKRAATTGQTAIVGSEGGDKSSNDAGVAAGPDTTPDSGASSGTADTSNMAGKNDQPGNSTAAPVSRPAISRSNAPANAPAAASGK
jgi:hypothetical protein